MEPFPFLVESQKAISHFPGWSKPEVETDYVWFNAPLEIGGVTEAGLTFHGGCYATRPECSVSFELFIRHGRRRVELARIDWRSLNGGHSNKRSAAIRSAGRRVSSTHWHSFDLNWNEAAGKMIGNGLPAAQEIGEELQSFEALRAYAGNCFKINNIALVAPPPWDYTLGLWSGAL